MRVSFYSPMPPSKTGVAHYAAMLVPALREHVEIDLNPATPPPGNRAVYQLGNNLQHEFVYRQAMTHPGVIVLHDVVLHHLIVEMTLARGDEAGYIEALRANHGEMGAASARGRIVGLHDELANFLMPASIDVASRSHAVIVHNQYAADRLRSFGLETPLFVVPHPYEPRTEASSLEPRASDHVVGVFGFLTSAKRAEVILEAFRIARLRNPKLRLLVVGEAAPNVGDIRGDGITVTGYVSDEQFDGYYARVDRLVNLRYPSAGESSGTLIRAFEAGKPVAVSDYAQFAELPDDIVTKIPFGEGEVDGLVEFFLADLPSPAAAQKRWLEQNARMDLTVGGYMEALRAGPASATNVRHHAAEGGALALFPQVALAWDGTTVTLRNDGDFTLRAGEYGQPGYRAILKVFDGDKQIADRWVALSRDLAPGEATRIEMSGGNRLTLTNALEGIALVDETPAAEVELRRVR